MFDKKMEENEVNRLSVDELLIDRTTTLPMVLAENAMKQTGMYESHQSLIRYEGDEVIDGVRYYFCGEYIKEAESKQSERTYYYLYISQDEFYYDDETVKEPLEIFEKWNHGGHRQFCDFNGMRVMMHRDELESLENSNFFDFPELLPRPLPKKIMDLPYSSEGLEYVVDYLHQGGYIYRGMVVDILKRHNGDCYHFINQEKCTGMKLYVSDCSLYLEQDNSANYHEYIDIDSISGIRDRRIYECFDRHDLCSMFTMRFNILHFLYCDDGDYVAKHESDLFKRIAKQILGQSKFHLVETDIVNDERYELFGSTDGRGAVKIMTDEESGAVSVSFYDSMSSMTSVIYHADIF